MTRKQVIGLISGFIVLAAGAAAWHVLTKKPRLVIVSTQARMSELEPCGCQQAQNQLGGVVREANALKAWRNVENFLYLAPGQMFLPETYLEYVGTEKHFAEKATFVVQAMNRLGIHAASPSAEDTALGMERLQALRKEAQFSILSANLIDKASGKPIFDTHKVFQFGEHRVGVTGVTQRSDDRIRLGKNVQIVDAKAALKPLLNGELKDVDLVILMSDLKDHDRDALVREFPQVRIVLGGQANVGNHRAYQTNKLNMHLTTSVKGRQIARIEVELGKADQPFFNKSFAEYIRGEKKWREERIVELREKMESADKNTKMSLEFAVDKLGFEIADLEEIPVKAERASLYYDSEVIDLNASYDKPSNELAEVVDAYKKAVHDIAVRE